MAMFASAEKFLAKHLGGRYQKSMTEAVAKRLGEITVNPKDVKTPESIKMNKKAAVDLTGKWNMTADAGGQVVGINVTIKQTKSTFTGTISSQFGDGKIQDGIVSGNNFTATALVDFQGQTLELKMRGKIENENMTGTMEGAGVPQISFTAVKSK